MHISLIFSLLFFAAFIVYLMFGIYTFQINHKSGLNRIFFALCLALCLWSLGFSVAVSAPHWEACFLWRRVAALGWGAAYSLLLHYILLLTGRRCSRRTWVICTLLYLPALVCIYAFALSERIALGQYQLSHTGLGWVNAAPQSALNTFFSLYFVSYTLLGLFLLLRWRRRNAGDPDIRRQAALFFSALAAAFFLGSLTDVFLGTALGRPLPQLAPILILLPVWAIYHSMKHYRLMERLPPEAGDVFLTHETLLKMQAYVGLAYLIGGLAATLSYFFPQLTNSQASAQAMIHAGILLSSIGLIVLLTQRIKSKRVREAVLLIAMPCSIPLITLQFSGYASITVWVFPMVLMIASLVFSSRKYLILLTVVAALTQLLVWTNAPREQVSIDEFDYLIRIGILLIAYMVGSFVNQTYISKIEENNFQISFQRLVSEVSADFISIHPSNMDEKFNRLLEKIGRFFLVDRTYIFLIDRERETMTYAYEWCYEGIKSEIDCLQAVPLDVFPWWMQELSVNKQVYAEEVSALPEAAHAEKETLTAQGVASVVVLPVEQDGVMLGFIGLDSVLSKKRWAPYHIELLKLLSHLIADALLRIESERTIEYMAYYDHLTGLPNRIRFSELLSEAIAQAQQHAQSLGVIFLDLDGFKMVNDTMGHSSGDAILKEVARGLLSRLREGDTVARFGGDEFLLLINPLHRNEEIGRIADAIMALFKQPFHVNEQEFYVTASAGIARYPIDGRDTETLIKNADIAMYMAKENGKNQSILCTPEIKEDLRRNVQLSNQLYRARERGQLLLHYQPQVQLPTGKITGVEALLRWQHPELGLLAPNLFIPLAEMNGTINSIGHWVLETAIRQNKRWQEKGYPPLRVAVNLSLVQFSNPDFAKQLIAMLRQEGLAPQYLELEITESVATKEAAFVAGTLRELQAFGVSISIDDFGTEYSSLSRLKTLPIDRIKIDTQFVQGIEGSPKDQAITKIIINLAKSLGLEVLAEGVETAPQLEFLSRKMCDEVQGFYCYRPMPAGEIEALFRLQESGGPPLCKLPERGGAEGALLTII